MIDEETDKDSVKKWEIYQESVWIEGDPPCRFFDRSDEEYLWSGPEDSLDDTEVHLNKPPDMDISSAEKLEAPLDNIMGWLVFDTRKEKQLLEWKKLKKNRRKNVKYCNS